MSEFRLLFSLYTCLLIIFSLLNPSRSAIDSFVYGGCSQLKYASGSVYESNLNSLLSSLVNSATFSLYNNFTISGVNPHDTIYGLYQCKGDLSMPDCATCISRAVSQLGVICFNTAGGTLQLQGCLIKYDNTTFLGVEDKTVVLNKCGPSIGYGNDAMNRRDAVLAELSSGGGPFRVGGSGDVQGMAQCCGDLSPSECQDCLSDSIGRLRTDCATAISGDIFLAKCYARFSGSGHYSSGSSHDNDDNDDETEKTLALIIGLFAGVALLIFFISSLRKAYERKEGK